MVNAAVTAKVHAKLKKRLTDDDYDQLMSFKGVSEVTSYLKHNTVYANVLANVNENYIHRGQLEEVLASTLISDYIGFFSYMDLDKKRILRLFKLKDEIEKIKLYLRLIESEHTERFINRSDPRTEKYQTINFSHIEGAKTREQFLEAISGTKYYQILIPFMQERYEHDMFNIEMALDMYYNKYTLKLIKKCLKGTDRMVINSTFGTETDLNNMSFILRAKKYYKLGSDSIYPYIIPNYYKLKKEDIKEMTEAATYEEAFEAATGTFYSAAFSADNKFLEKSIAQFSVSNHKKMFKNNPYSIAAPLMYIHLKEAEIRNIVRIIEGIKYGLARDEIKTHLIH